MSMTRDHMLARFYARDRASDGRFIVGVLSTGIYCLPSCPARKPHPEHVRFFRDETAAQRAGLRACRRCRPDAFRAGQDPERELVDDLVAGVRRRPVAFASLRCMADYAGIGTTKLHELVRRHCHLTPSRLLTLARIERAAELLAQPRASVAEVAFAVGFDSLSTFNANFRRTMRLSPAAYRELGSDGELQLTLPADFRREAAWRSLARDPDSPTERRNGTALTRVLTLGERMAMVHIAPTGHALRVQARMPERPDGALMRGIHAQLIRWLGLDIDPRPFEARVHAMPEHRALVAGRRGLRPTGTPTPFEALCWAIVGQQVALPVAFAQRRALIELAGTACGEGRAHPAPVAIARLDYADLTSRKLSRRKAEYLIDTAREIVDGNLDLDGLPRASATHADQRLHAVRGLGPWAANYLMLRGFGFGDCLPVGDAGLRRALQLYAGLEAKPNAAETRRLMAPFAPYRSLATCHLWAFLSESRK